VARFHMPYGSGRCWYCAGRAVSWLARNPLAVSSEEGLVAESCPEPGGESRCAVKSLRLDCWHEPRRLIQHQQQQPAERYSRLAPVRSRLSRLVVACGGDDMRAVAVDGELLEPPRFGSARLDLLHLDLISSQYQDGWSSAGQ